MREYLSEGIILAAFPNGDLDLRLSVFTKDFGKLRAKVKSARKITSKLAGHLQPGFITKLRIIEKNGLQIVDALKIGVVGVSQAELEQLEKLLPEMEPEPNLWSLADGGNISWPNILKTLGWDPAQATCAGCGGNPVVTFRLSNQDFFCAECASKINPNQLIFI